MGDAEGFWVEKLLFGNYSMSAESHPAVPAQVLSPAATAAAVAEAEALIEKNRDAQERADAMLAGR